MRCSRGKLDSGYAWVVLASGFVCHMIVASSWSTFGLYYIEFLRNFDEYQGLLACMWAILGATWGLAGVVVGQLITLFGSRTIAYVGAVCGCAGYLIPFFCYDFTIICLSYGLLVGFANCCIVSSAYVAVQHNFDKKRSLANGLSTVGGNFGLFSFPPLIEFLIAEYGWRGGFLIQSAVYLNVIVAASLFSTPNVPLDPRVSREDLDDVYVVDPDEKTKAKLVEDYQGDQQPKNRVQQREDPNEKEHRCAQRHGTDEQNDLQNISYEHIGAGSIKRIFRKMFSCDRSILTDYKFILYTIGYFCYQYGHHTPMVFIVPRANDYGISKDMAALLMSSWAVGGTVGFILIGWIGDKFSRLGVCGASCVGAGLFTAGTCWFRRFPLLCFYSVSFGLFSGGFYGTNVPALVDVVGPEKVAIANGLVLTPSGIAGLIAAPFASWLTFQTGSYSAAFIFAGSIMFIGGTLLVLISVINLYHRKTKNPRSTKYNVVFNDVDINTERL